MSCRVYVARCADSGCVEEHTGRGGAVGSDDQIKSKQQAQAPCSSRRADDGGRETKVSGESVGGLWAFVYRGMCAPCLCWRYGGFLWACL